MKLLLSSDGKTAIDNIFRLITKNPKETNIAFIATASEVEENKSYVDTDLNHLKNIGYKPKIYKFKNKSKFTIENELKTFDLIFVEGGNTFYLLKVLKDSGADEVIKKLVELGKPYVGVSAGSLIPCPTIEVSTWKNQNRNLVGLTDLSALNFVDFLIVVHYDEKYHDVISKGIKNTKYDVRILKDGQALLVQNKDVKLIGDHSEIHL